MAWRPELSISGAKAAFNMTAPDTYTVDTAPTPDAVTAITNRVSGTSWSEATNPPEYQAAGFNGHPCMKFDGSNDRIISTESAVVNLFAGTDTAWTLIAGAMPVTVDAGMAMFGAGNSGTATNDSYRIGQSTTGSGRWFMSKIDPGGVNGNGGGDTDLVSEPQMVSWVHTGTTISIYKNHTAHLSAGASDVAYDVQSLCARVQAG
jgi:hypothetical protein